MNRFTNAFAITALALAIAPAFAAEKPVKLTTHNNTNVESNAFIAGIVPSTHPTKAHSSNSVSWTEVGVACRGRIDKDNKCPADIMMKTNTASPVKIGQALLDMKTGTISIVPTDDTTYIVKGNNDNPREPTTTLTCRNDKCL